MDIDIYRYIEGSKEARGLTVIIDVFRAFSLECYLFSWGAEKIYPAGTVDEAQILARRLAEDYPDKKIITIGERQGIPLEGFTYGNSPSQIKVSITEFLENTIAVHTTSAGTQGIVNSINASEIITGSLVNARAVSEYIKRINPDKVSLVAMGNSGIKEAPEDE
ncbi:MAG: 2-phosphosulfolactate phosphatase [Clostridia bacterium]|nr:2-phosphosulfolactate phosphatase [Clostridia bacterium]